MPTSVLVILLTFSGLTPPNQALVQARYATASALVQHASYGQHAGLATTVTAPLLVNGPQTCDMGETETAARQLATAAGYDLSLYATVVYLQPRGNCTTIGASTVLGFHTGQMLTWLWTDEQHTINHELGHTLGLMHSGSVDCGALVNTGSACAVDEVGGWLSSMSGFTYRSTGQYSAYERTLLGWMTPFVAPSAVGSYTYALSPIETAGSAIRIPRADGKEYWIEWRQPLLEDSYLSSRSFASQINGATVWEAATTAPTEYDRINSQRQLDMSPDTKSIQTIGALPSGKTFDDTVNRIRIKTISTTNGQLIVTITRY